MKLEPGSRAVLACVMTGFALTGVSARLVQLQWMDHEKYAEAASRKHLLTVEIPSRRGLIYDRNGELLAGNQPLIHLLADGTRVRDAEKAAAVVAPWINLSEKEIAAKITAGIAAKNYNIEIERNITEERAAGLKQALKITPIAGLMLRDDMRRIYPNGTALCHVIGFLGFDRRGVHGVERSMEEWLRGVDGRRNIERDGSGAEIVSYRGEEIPARDGASVYLTIDMGLQTITERMVDSVMAEHKPKSMVVILSRPSTGEILAMVSRPAFDPRTPGKQGAGQTNRAIASVIEPGSTFKIVVVAAAMNERLADLDTTIFCENGKFYYGGRDLNDHRPFGDLTVRQILARSSNIGSVKLALQLGENRYYNYIRRFGFGFKTGIELPGELPGIVHSPENWNSLSIARIPIGQGIAVTPLQMLTAMNVIANGGRLVEPRLVSRIEESSGRVVKKFEPAFSRTVISLAASKKVATALEDVTGPQGTGRLAAVPPFRVAGKTGTAQKAAPNGRGYLDGGRYVLSFVGYLPAEDPQISMIIVVDEPQGSKEDRTGGRLAGPIFAALAARAASYLNLQPSPAGPIATAQP